MITYTTFKKTISGVDKDFMFNDKWEVWGYIGKRIYYNITVYLTDKEIKMVDDGFDDIIEKKAYKELKRRIK